MTIRELRQTARTKRWYEVKLSTGIYNVYFDKSEVPIDDTFYYDISSVKNDTDVQDAKWEHAILSSIKKPTGLHNNKGYFNITVDVLETVE